jgi:23S rRNA G2445 N2-methylase RlmL
MSVPASSQTCFALTIPGLECLAAAEIEQRLHADVKRTERGIIIFRPPVLDRQLFRLRLVEDVFLYAWGTDQLTYRAVDLQLITRWTRREVDWSQLFQLHHSLALRAKVRPTYHLVTQMRGEHGYRRVDARDALAEGLRGRIPPGWQARSEGAAVEIWLRIEGKRAVCGVRLTDQRMRHRLYKQEHLPASLRPVVAAAMVHLAAPGEGELLVDPLCGAGTILAERLAENRAAPVLGGDCQRSALYAAATNLRHWCDEPPLALWDATELPLPDRSITCLVTNPPFGKQIGSLDEVEPFYAELLEEFDRILASGGRAVLLAGDDQSLQKAAFKQGWLQEQRLRLRLLGQACFLSKWRKT